MVPGKDTSIVHRPGPFKQTNKPHKGGHNRNRRNEKGRLNIKNVTQKKMCQMKRADRKNQMNQLRKNKRDQVMMKKRLGDAFTPPILVAILSVNGSVEASKLLEEIKTCDEDLVVKTNLFDYCHISSPRLKKRFTFFVPDEKNLHSVMDAMKVADVLLIMHSSMTSLPDEAEKLLSIILAHALPTTIHVVQGLLHFNPKKKAEYKKNILKTMETRFCIDKLHMADTRQEVQLLLQQIGSQKQRSVGFRDARPYLIAENLEFFAPDETSGYGTLKVSGYVRGQPLNVNGLVHIPGWDNYQMTQIEYANDPFPLLTKKAISKRETMKDQEMAFEDVVLIDKCDPLEQESLQSEIIPDPMEGEQTWPTQEELEAAQSKETKKVVKGTSDYQAAWIINSDDDNDDESSGHSDNEEETMSQADIDMESDTEAGSQGKDDYDRDMDLDAEEKMHVRFKEERMNEMFPDEEDTPIDVSARVRYQKYRGLKNFNAAPWDPLENLPLDYARIYRFANFKQTQKKVVALEGTKPGLYVTIYVDRVPRALYDSKDVPLVVYGLLRHEQKMSLMNVVIRKHDSCETPVKSKDTLIFHVGYRRFVCNPIFSEHKTGNKFKYERFLPGHGPVVASFYAPVMFPPASVVVLRRLQDGSEELVGSGTLLDMNPNRVVVKRVVLSGHPFKIFKRSAVVRYMFFTKEDVCWFKRVELRTKCGRRGHIKEALGSHGHMKCRFDQQLQSQDVVLMCLYKRVFPKWTYDGYVPS